MEKYTCLVVDDEKLAQELIESYIHKIPNLEWVHSCSSALEAMAFLSNKDVDILFLDIQMPDLTGIEFLRNLKNQPATIFTTAYSEYALEGFELSVVDYLLKPIVFERFFKAVTKAIDHLSKKTGVSSTTSTPQATKANPEKYFFIKSDNQIVKIAFEEVLFIEALQKYIRIHMTSKRVVSLLSLSKIEEMLPTHQFVRIHRSYLINLDQIENIEGNMVRVSNYNKHLPISKGQKEPFMEAVRKKGLFS